MKALTQQEVEEYCESQGYKVLSPYKNNSTQIKLQNIETGEIGNMRFGNFKKGQRFDTKKILKKLTYQQYIQPFTDESYTVLIDEKEYKNVTTETKIDVLCPNNHQWGVRRRNFTSSQNQRCPMCNQDTGGMSLGEKLVYQILQGNNITFEREKSVYIDGNRYRFDYYFEIEEFGNIDRFFIEYDGEQHYHDVSGYMFRDSKRIHVSDEIKDKYAHDNNIQMVRIPWLNNTIDKVLFVINNETGLNLQKVQVDLPTIQKISDYYLSHSIKETMDKFNIGKSAVNRYFNQIYGMSKKEYLSTPEYVQN